jgi:tetratricopeptide (TPR) repeat protein
VSDHQLEKAQDLFTAANEAEDKGDLLEALSLYQQVTELDPTSPIPGCMVASTLMNLGRLDEASTVARRVIKRWPRSAPTLGILGDCYRKLGKLAFAERAYRKAINIEPQPWTWVLLSYILMRTGREEESIACLQSALKLNPDYEEAHYNLGVEFRIRKQYKRAEKHLRRAIEIDPGYAIAYAELGWLLLRDQNGVRQPSKVAESVKLLKKSIKIYPHNGWARIYLANAYWGLRKYKAADEQYRTVIELWPQDSIPYWCYGSFLAYEGKDKILAEKYLRHAVQLDPKDAEANYNLGKHLYYWNNNHEAIKYLKKAVKLGEEKALKVLRKIGPIEN